MRRVPTASALAVDSAVSKLTWTWDWAADAPRLEGNRHVASSVRSGNCGDRQCPKWHASHRCPGIQSGLNLDASLISYPSGHGVCPLVGSVRSSNLINSGCRQGLLMPSATCASMKTRLSARRSDLAQNNVVPFAIGVRCSSGGRLARHSDDGRVGRIFVGGGY
jgi:hypothetical protein